MYHIVNDVLMSLNKVGSVFCDYAASVFIQSALLVILLFMIDLLLRKRIRAVFRYCLWLLVLVKLILPPMLSLPTGIGYWVGDHLPVAPGALNRPFDVVALEQTAPTGEMPQIRPAENIAGDESAMASENSTLTPLTWRAVVFLLWLMGVLAFLAVLFQRIRFVRGLVAASCPASDELTGLLEQCRRQMTVRQEIKLRLSEAIPSPAVCGFLRPIVLMPSSLVEKLSPEGLRATLIHELAHIKRGDLWVNSIQTFLQVVYFYNPFVWFANFMIRKVCEEAVDETVLVALGGQAEGYSNTLIDIGEMVFWKADFGLRLIGVAESKKALQWRIKHMLNRPIPKTSKLGALGIAALVVVGTLLLPMARADKSGGASQSIAGENEAKPASLLHRAVAEGDIEQVKLLLSKGIDVNKKNERGWTPLHVASRHGRRDIAELLLAKGVEIDAKDSSGATPLHLAVRRGLDGCVSLLIAKGANINARNNVGNTPLHSAVRYKHIGQDMLELLLDKGADLDARNNYGHTPLHFAAIAQIPYHGDHVAINFLLAHGANINAKDKKGNTPLHIATGNGRRDSVELLLAKGAAIDEKTDKGFTVLHQAAVLGHTDIAELIIRQIGRGNSALDSEDMQGCTPLHHASMAGSNDIVERLISNDVYVNARNAHGATPVHLAILRNHKDTVKLLISKGMDVSTIQVAAYVGDLAKVKGFIEQGVSVNAQDGYGLTPLHAAAGSGQNEIVKFLITEGASVNADAVEGGLGMPLHYAIDGGSKNTAELLISKGSAIEARNKSGETPLYLAARKGHSELVRLLIANKANVNVKTGNGSTPLYVAAQNGKEDTVKLLIENGADINILTEPRKLTPLFCAARAGHKGVMKILLDKGADVSPVDGVDGLLYWVCKHGDADLAETLIQKGANVNSKTEGWDDAPSLYAVWNNQPEVLGVLLAHGADPNAKDRWDWSLLHYTVDSVNRSLYMTRMLLEKGANPNAKLSTDGSTPFGWAVWYDLNETVELFIAHGADINVKDSKGQTPLQYAKDKGYTEMVELLKKHGAKE